MLKSDKINLEKISFLIVDDNQNTLDILGQVISGFGCRNITRCLSVEEAIKTLKTNRIDFVLTDAEMPVQTGYDLINWLRREASEPNRFAPAVVVTGHTRLSNITRARDCGANFVITKPIQADVLLQRIFWVAKDERMFVDCEAYAGPDRRFKFEGPPSGEGRRDSDLSAELGEATDPNLSQDELDSMLKVRKVAV